MLNLFTCAFRSHQGHWRRSLSETCYHRPLSFFGRENSLCTASLFSHSCNPINNFSSLSCFNNYSRLASTNVAGEKQVSSSSSTRTTRTRKKQSLTTVDDSILQTQNKQETTTTIRKRTASTTPRKTKSKEAFNNEKSHLVFSDGKRQINLNDEQQRVVFESIDKNILVLACAGSGKTATVLCRICYLVKDHHIKEEEIMLTTFSRQAAHEMTKRLGKMLGKKKTNIEAGTIDSISYKYLQKYSSYDYVMDSSDSLLGVKEIGYRFRNLLMNNPEIADQICSKIKYLFIDEFQDIDDTQMEVFSEFYKRGTKIIAVGDDSQNIYSWRGSNVFHILNFHKNFENTVVHNLVTNFRSTEEIVSLANASLACNLQNIPKDMISNRGSSGHLPMLRCCYMDQTRYLLEAIKQHRDSGVSLHQIAILCHSNFGLYEIESELAKHHIPHVLLMDNLKKDSRRMPSLTNKICLTTIHKAKGLEWDIVYIINATDKYWKETNNSAELRRLFYVAITRAKTQLYFTFPDKTGGQHKDTTPTYLRFLRELNHSLYKTENISPLHKREDVRIDRFLGIKNPYAVTEMVRSLNGAAIDTLRQKGYLPILKFKQQQLIETQFSYCEVVHYNQLYPDFGTFIDTLICRMIAEQYPKSGGFSSKYVELATNYVSLSSSEYQVYSKYYAILNQTLQEHGHFQEIFNQIETSDEQLMRSVVIKIEAKAKELKIGSMEELPVFIHNALPREFEQQMIQNYNIFRNDSKNSFDILNSIWEISKCEAIVKEGRTRLLYLSAFPYQKYRMNMESIMNRSYSELLDTLQNVYIPHLMNQVSHDIHSHLTFSRLDRIVGEIDLIIDGHTLVEIKCSTSKEVDLDWVLQLLCYTHLARQHGYEIQKIAILNPLQGLWFESDISFWNAGEELLQELKEFTNKVREQNHK
ncbi:hypothetical protein C9374_007876 [Naegleria lovaniensis]|uniref:DNA 3'-5' helicase n=1 Tax=Naegleria lovaniensis TaxID=51637 RepID=A0AA88GM38_NAELO|nr:uncharacterized protein C9374_007876 [Naegleria lovaniensis]KAG2378728.1 hypothetical protein C9374_007876 [Naegleria lovaniensis]